MPERRLHVRRLETLASACLALALGCAAAQAAPASLVGALEGDWCGEAVRTPVGPLPYDMSFERRPDGAVAGVANPGAALHHWTFSELKDGPRLRFLTTFGGNDEPMHLVGSAQEDGYRFASAAVPGLALTVSPVGDALDIRVRLDGQPHVAIHLERCP